jgi:precorrin-4 methylase
MSKDSILKVSQTDWEALDAMEDEDIDLSDIPGVTAEQMAKAILRVGGKPGSG